MWLIIISVLLFLVLLGFFIMFKTGDPKTWKDFKVLIHQEISGFLSFIEDKSVGLCYNKVSLYKQPSTIAVLTGGNRGIGLEVLKKLLQCEMTVVLGVRNIDAAKKSVESYIDNSLLENRVIYEICDTGDMQSVREFAKRVQKNFSAVNLLINNAGIMGVPYHKTKDGYESQMAVNYTGHFLLTHLLMPQLIAGAEKSNKSSRIVNVSSCAHYSGEIKYEDFHCIKNYCGSTAYSDSKVAQVMFTKYLNKLCMENNWNVKPYSCHPGIVNTDIFQHSAIGSFGTLKKIIMKTPEQGSRTIVYAAIAPEIESKSGIYLSNCRPTDVSQKARNIGDCRKFFDFTCEMLSVKKFGTE